jgi:hypothetical protein
MAFEEDMSVFFADFGHTIWITPENNPHPSTKTIEVIAIIDDEYVEVNGIECVMPVLTGSLADLSSVERDAQVTDRDKSIDYMVKGFQPESEGAVKLILERVSG